MSKLSFRPIIVLTQKIAVTLLWLTDWSCFCLQMTGIIPGYWATSGPIHFINQPTRFLCTSGKPGITTHAHTQFHSHINASVLQYFLPSAPSSFLSLTRTHTNYSGMTESHSHTDTHIGFFHFCFIACQWCVINQQRILAVRFCPVVWSLRENLPSAPNRPQNTSQRH